MKDENGFVGFCFYYLIKNEEYKDEFVVFFGVFYFCLVGKN